MDTKRRLVLATRNPGKVNEIRALLSHLPVVPVPADALNQPLDVVEDAPTLSGNARKKALAYHRHTSSASLADDTGLEVDALDGAPGVHTARFAGPEATAVDNIAALLDALNDVPPADRTARFRTVVCFVTDDGTPHTFEGVCNGRILTAPRGSGGFGYDPVFSPDGDARSFAEMDAEAKNAISHRKKALAAFSTFFDSLFSD